MALLIPIKKWLMISIFQANLGLIHQGMKPGNQQAEKKEKRNVEQVLKAPSGMEKEPIQQEN
jgi:hypothetical protein